MFSTAINPAMIPSALTLTNRNAMLTRTRIERTQTMTNAIKSKTSRQAYDEMQVAFQDDRPVHLIDVRTQAEWSYVGVPDTPYLKTIWWVRFPDGDQNKDFLNDVDSADIDKDDAVYLMCRSGVRSLAAANLLLRQGFSNLTNVSDGFEGDLDTQGHRGNINGWRQTGLPWRQS